ncbi:class I SAM-dependent methyltransferase [Candidatus Woesearchaeota archaeon]|nr:class I SAM-dependent methyltransferase [Candidatus Woesearchaeota archaeon]
MEPDYFDYLLKQDTFPRSLYNRTKKRFVLNQILKLRGKKILDAGVGNGYILKDISDQNRKVGIDLNPRALTYCRENLRGEFISTNLEQKLPFKNNSFDIIICTETIEHMQKPDSLIKEFYRILKKGGKLIVTTNNYDSFLWLTIERLWYPIFGGSCQPHKEEIHPSKLNPMKMRGIFEKHFKRLKLDLINLGMTICISCEKSE